MFICRQYWFIHLRIWTTHNPFCTSLWSGSSGNQLSWTCSKFWHFFAMQIAKVGGAHVTVTCGARNFEFLRSLGADEVIDYKTPEGAALKSPSGKKYDVIINCAPHQPFKLYKAQLAPTGFVIDMNPSPKGLFTSAVHVASFSKQKYYPFMHIPNSMDMYFLFNLIQTKKLTTVIDSTYPLAKSQEAWAKCMEGHAVGKIVITCAQGS